MSDIGLQLIIQHMHPLCPLSTSLWWVVFYAFRSANAIFSWSPAMSCGFQAYGLL